MRGHEEASGTKYVPKELLEAWEKKDPIANYENYLMNEEIITKTDINSIKKEIKQEIDDAVTIAFSEEDVHADTKKELADIYAPTPNIINFPPSSNKTEKRFIDAISDAMR